MPDLSPRRKALKAIGISIVIIGGIIIVYALMMDPADYYFIIPGEPVELGEVRGSTRYFQLGVGFIGIVLMFVGYKTFRFIPYSEREREYISEENL